MTDYKKMPTSPEVWAVIHARHTDLKVFASYTAPDGDMYGDHNLAVMMTEYCLPGADYPLIGCRTTYPVGKRYEAVHEYWICAALRESA